MLEMSLRYLNQNSSSEIGKTPVVVALTFDRPHLVVQRLGMVEIVQYVLLPAFEGTDHTYRFGQGST